MQPEAYEEMAQTEHLHWWFRGRRAILADILRRLGLPPEARILEVGSGTGGNLELLGSLGQVTGVERYDVARDYATARQLARVELLPGSCPSGMPAFSDRFDLICLLDVLEHIEEDAATLRTLAPLLADGGRILITVPAYPWLWGPHDEFLHHKRRYWPSQLRAIAATAGLSVTRCTYFNTLLFPLACASRLADKLSRRSKGSGTAIPSPWLNRVLEGIFASERWLLRRANLPFGVSLLCVLQRQPC